MAYLDAVTAGREPPVTGAAALETIGLLQRIYDTAAVLHLPTPGPRTPGELAMMAECSELSQYCAGTRSSRCWARTWTPAT
jgi:hypothetical protein